MFLKVTLTLVLNTNMSGSQLMNKNSERAEYEWITQTDKVREPPVYLSKIKEVCRLHRHDMSHCVFTCVVGL